MSTLYFFIGLPASGKTTIANEMYAFDYNSIFLDSDIMRAELFSDAEYQGDNALVFNTMYARTVSALKTGNDVYYVACNIWQKKRISLLTSLKKCVSDVKCICYVVNTTVETCFARNAARERHVPEYVIDRQLKQFQFPVKAEGWDDIYIIDGENYNSSSFAKQVWDKVRSFGSQDNPHHSLTLYGHLLETVDNCSIEGFSKEERVNLLAAAALHDIGKCYTRTYDESGIAHYYSHENMSAYLAMNLKAPIETIQLINYHMLPFNQQGIPTWKKRLGEDLWHKIEVLHAADVEAH